MEQKKIVFIIDFDGTITTQDIGLSLLTQYCISDQWKEWEDKIINSEVDLKTGYKGQFDLLNVGQEEVQKVIRDISPDPFVHRFLRKVENTDIPVIIASDGFDLYIKPYLNMYFPEFRNYTLYCNHATRNHEGNWEITFPFTCLKNDNHGCALCKVRIITEEQLKGFYVIYIGDGTSDFRPSLKSDRVFAKKGLSLEKFLKKRNYPFQTYKNFDDIIQQLATKGIFN